jgi:hypothetical protein
MRIQHALAFRHGQSHSACPLSLLQHACIMRTAQLYPSAALSAREHFAHVESQSAACMQPQKSRSPHLPACVPHDNCILVPFRSVKRPWALFAHVEPHFAARLQPQVQCAEFNGSDGGGSNFIYVSAYLTFACCLTVYKVEKQNATTNAFSKSGAVDKCDLYGAARRPSDCCHTWLQWLQ